MRSKVTKIVLWFTLVAVGVCMLTIVALEILETGNWWVMLYLVWAVVIELFILMLLKVNLAKALGGKG